MIDWLNENEQDSTPSNTDTWKILIVDDDPDIIRVSKLSLSDIIVEGRQLEFLQAESAIQAKRILREHSDIAMAFIDVVMETDSAGLDLIRWIRRELENNEVRIILRTGQPGHAPESRVMIDYAINDYKNKTEMTHHKMLTAVHAGIRNYSDLMNIKRGVMGFNAIIESSRELVNEHDIEKFAVLALEHVCELIDQDINKSSLVLARKERDYLGDDKYLLVCAEQGKLCSISKNMDDWKCGNVEMHRIKDAFCHRKNIITDEYYVSHYASKVCGTRTVLHLELLEPLPMVKQKLLDVMATNISVLMDSLMIQYDIHSSSEELFIMGEAIEARSAETSGHVRRVSLMSKRMAELLLLEKTHCTLIADASPLHDLGKIAIPDDILHKPGKLTREEWEIMKTHTTKGAEILSKSDNTIARIAERIALNHHENWDGSGYPHGLTEYDIPIEARIVALMDVYDSLGAHRCYDEPWHEERILELIIDLSGRKFDPELVDLFIRNHDEFKRIKNSIPDH